MHGLPEAFIARMASRLGDELPQFLQAMDEPYKRGIRLNPMKPVDVPIPGMLEAVPWEPCGLYLTLDSQAGAIALHEAGAYYLQEPSAMLPAAVMNPQPGETILDLCAAPGGKSTQLALRMQGQGLIVCNEPVPKRAQILARNIERMGVPNAIVVSAMPDKLAQRWPEGFNGVQVDAPCSGEGMFRRHPETRDEWTSESPAGCAKRQAEILDAAAQLVRPGGRIVYSTCTLNAEENENTVAAFCERHPEFAVKAFSLPGADAPEGMLTCYPHRMAGEGHFVALLVREGDAPVRRTRDSSLPAPDKATLKAYRDFAGAHAPTPQRMLGSVMTCLDDCPDLRGLKVLRCGLHLGEVRGKLFMPDHAWAVSQCRPDCPSVPLTEAQAAAYLAGEVITVDESSRGWVLPTLHGLVLGWGKASGGMMKNHYPKGLRRTTSQMDE